MFLGSIDEESGLQQVIIKKRMGLEIDSQIFKWLQGLQIIKEGKRTPSSAVQLSQQASSKFYDGLYISHIVKILLKDKRQEDAIQRLQAIKQNSTPAIRLYNWNLLSDALKILGYPLDYGEKSKILNLEVESIQKILRFLFSIRSNGLGSQDKKLQVSTNTVGQKTLKEASNIFQFLVISISNHFKLSVQHTLNLFLDQNKFLAHLLVKGIKGIFDPILLFLDDISSNIEYIIQTLFCVDQKQSVTFLMNALKPCLISKSQQVAQKCLYILKEVYETYLKKSIDPVHAIDWIQADGINTIFFGVKRHHQLFSQAFSISYGFLQSKLFGYIQPQEKSLLWNSQIEKVTFLRDFFENAHDILLKNFLQSNAFGLWNKYCVKLLKKSKNTQELSLLITIYQILWTEHTSFFESNQLNLPSTFINCLKISALMPSEIIFTESTKTLFQLLIMFGIAKNGNAPNIFKTLVSIFSFQQQRDRIDFLVLNFLQAFNKIPALPTVPLAQSVIKYLQIAPSSSIVQLAKIILADQKLKQQQAEDILESLAKLVFQDIQYGTQAAETMVGYLSQNHENSLDSLGYYCKATLAHFVSTSKELYRTIRELKSDYQNKKGEATFLRNMQKYLILGNLVIFLQKAIANTKGFREEIEPLIFHTYIKLSREMRKQHIAKILMPLLLSFYEDDQLEEKVRQYENQIIESITSSPIHNASEDVSQVFQTPSPRKQKYLKIKQKLKTQQMQKSKVQVSQSVKKDLQDIKKKRQIQREKSIQISRQQSVLAEKKQAYRSVINEKRIIQFGKKYQNDVDYKNLVDFDSIKQDGNAVGLPNIQLINLASDQQQVGYQDAQTYMKRYRKVWRFLFFKFSTFGAKATTDAVVQQKINMSEVWKMLKEYQFDIIKRQQSQTVIRKVNEAMKRRTDLQNLTYTGFEQYLLQMCHFAYTRFGYAHIPPARQLALFIEQIRSVTASRGANTEIFDNPDQVYFQETDVIRQFNKRLKENPDYVLPQGYKKIKQVQLTYNYTINPQVKGMKNNYAQVFQILNEVLWQKVALSIIEPKTGKIQKCLARPALFQKLKDKIKDYTGGYLMPKRSADLSRVFKEASPVKLQYHHLPNFSLGIKLGLAGVDVKYKAIAEEVAYWLDDALDAVEAGKSKVNNKAKIRVQNELIRRKKSEAYQFKLQMVDYEKKQKVRAETVKAQAKKFIENKQALDKKKRQDQKKQRENRKLKEQKELKRKLQQFQQAKSKLQAKRRLVQQAKQQEIHSKKKQKEEYRKNVDQYFKKKKEQIQQKQKTYKANKDWQSKQQLQKKTKQVQRKKKLQIQVFRKQEQVLQKIVESRQTYQQIWRSPDIQQDLMDYRPRLKLLFDLLLRYEKSKISSTSSEEIGFNTLNFFALRTYIVPFLLPKNSFTLLYRSSVRLPGCSGNGLNFIQFQQFLFKIAVKSKDILNRNKNGNNANDLQQSQVPQLPTLKSSSQFDKKKKSLTDEYTLDANGVQPQTVKRLMNFIILPFDKQQAEERFRTMLQNTSSLPTSLILKQAQNFLDSLP